MFLTAPGSKSLLWEVMGKDVQQPSYFLGTMHLMFGEDAVLSETTKEVIQQVEQVYLEADMNNMWEFADAANITMADGVSLADFLTEEKYEQVKAFFEEHQPDVPFAVLERQQPLMLSSSLYELFLPGEVKNGVDVKVIEEANRLQKETKGLETIAFQASLFNYIPYADQAVELVKTIDSLDRYGNYLKEMVELYRTRDIEQLHDLATKEESGINAHTDLLLYDRNKNWVNQFTPIAKQRSTLFAVGAGHLGGKQGVINLLKQEGYSVRPLLQ